MQFQQDSATAHMTHNSVLIWMGWLVIGLYHGLWSAPVHLIFLHMTFIYGIIWTMSTNTIPIPRKTLKKANLQWVPGFLPRGKAAGA